MRRYPFIPVLAALACAFAVSVSTNRAASGSNSSPNPAKLSTVPPLAVGAWATTPPPAVSAAFKKAYPDAKILSVSKEGNTYEIESMDGKQRRDLVYKPDGTLVLYEEFIETKEMPEAVIAAIKARYPKATLGQCEKLFKDNTMNYEAAIKGAGSVAEVILTPDGKWVSPK